MQNGFRRPDRSIEGTRIRHRWAEKDGFTLERPQGASENILLHFLTPVDLTYAGRTVPVQPGSLIMFSAGYAHSFTAKGALLHDWLHITGDVSEMMNRYGLKVNTLYKPDMASAISEMIAFLELEFFAQRPFWPQLCDAKLSELFIRTAHSLADTQPKINIRDETVEHLRELRTRILSDPWRSWTIAELAQRANISQSRLHAVYKTVFGISPKHDLILMRIEKAKQILLRGESVSSAAEQLGYSSVYHFIRQFRQFTGTTPKQYSLNQSLRNTSSM